MQYNFTNTAKKIMEAAGEIVLEFGDGYMGTEHILLSIMKCEEGMSAIVLYDNGVTYDKLYELIKEVAGTGNVAVMDAPGYSPKVEHMLELALKEAEKFGVDTIGTEHMLLGILKDGECVAAQLLAALGVSAGKVYKELLMGMGPDARPIIDEVIHGKSRSHKKNMLMVEQYSRDLTEYARNGQIDPVIGRETEISRVIQIMSRRTKNNPCLIGESGVGKTAIAEGLAQRIADGNVPESIINKRVLALDISSMVAGTKYRGEFEERIKKVLNEVRKTSDILLFIDEIHTVIGAGSAEGSLDAANIIKPALARGELQVIGATTTDEYRKHFEKDAALERRFQPVMIEEPSIEDSILILKGLREKYEDHHHVVITDEAIEAAVNLSARYVNDRFLPDKAVDLMDEAASRVRLDKDTIAPKIRRYNEAIASLEDEKEEALRNKDYNEVCVIKNLQNKLRSKLSELNNHWDKNKSNDDKSEGYLVTENDIAQIVSDWTHIPVKKLEEEESARLKRLESILHKRVIGQDEAVTAVARAVRRGRVGLKDPGRPIGSFLFLGPTGVGKTELAKALAEAVFGREDAVIRVDMSEYMEKHSVSKLIGSPPGYVGYEEGGQLSEKIRRNPYSVLLFDEVEKAHPDLFNILLQVLDDGHITDAKGRKVDFKNTIIIMTSNAGAANIVAPKKLGFSISDDKAANHKQMKDKVMEEVKRLFKPEFLNRIDETIVFHALDKANMREIADILLKNVVDRIQKQLGLQLVLSDEVIAFLCEKGYDEKYGARPLKRAIQKELEDKLAESYLDGAFAGEDRVYTFLQEGGISFGKC